MLKVNFKNGIISVDESKILDLELIDLENVILKVKYSGLCGSDMHRIRDFLNLQNSIPTLGHEVVGEVVSTNNQKFKVGDFVVVMPIGFCGQCENCNEGKTQFCINPVSIGKNTDGGFSEFLKVPSKLLYKITNLDKNYVLTDSFACVLHAENLIGKIKNKKVCIFGDGAISELAVRYLSLDNNVINFVKNMEEVSDKYAKRIKVTNTNEINRYNKYFDVVLECVGGRNEDLINLAGEILNLGGKLVILGVYDKDFYPKIYLRNLFYKEINVQGSNSFIVTKKLDEFGDAVSFITNNSNVFSDIVTHELPIAKFNEGLEIFKNKKISGAKKIVFV